MRQSHSDTFAGSQEAALPFVWVGVASQRTAASVRFRGERTR